MTYIRGLPINDTPEMFGLHDNANITFALNETSSLLEGFLKLQPKSASGAGHSREEVSYHCSCGKNFDLFVCLFVLLVCLFLFCQGC